MWLAITQPDFGMTVTNYNSHRRLPDRPSPFGSTHMLQISALAFSLKISYIFLFCCIVCECMSVRLFVSVHMYTHGADSLLALHPFCCFSVIFNLSYTHTNTPYC